MPEAADTRFEHHLPSFERTAPSYDEEFETLPATARLRAITSGTALRHFKPGGRILELNCGTGTDAVYLAENGLSVLATDASPAMLHEAEKKVAAKNLSSSITLQMLPFDDLGRLDGQFDGAFSNMGGLNCTPSLQPIAKELSRLLKPGAYLVACLLSDFCLWETFTFLLRGRIHEVFRRRARTGVSVTLHGIPSRVYYFSPLQVTQQFFPYFRRVSVIGLNIFSPPPSFRTVYKILGQARSVLEALDDATGRFYPFDRLGDHFLIVLERKSV